MKLFCALFVHLALAAAAFASVNPQLHQVKRVYILAMGSGMDQYLANQLTTAGIFEVVTDPKKADAIVTDNVGEAFQKKLDDLYPPPAPPKTEAEADQARRGLRHYARCRRQHFRRQACQEGRDSRTWILAAAAVRYQLVRPRQGQFLRGGSK